MHSAANSAVPRTVFYYAFKPIKVIWDTGLNNDTFERTKEMSNRYVSTASRNSINHGTVASNISASYTLFRWYARRVYISLFVLIWVHNLSTAFLYQLHIPKYTPVTTDERKFWSNIVPFYVGCYFQRLKNNKCKQTQAPGVQI